MTRAKLHQATIDESLRRGFDISLATLGLIVLAPLMLLVSLAILIETGRPILFAQERLGKNGRRFRIQKFRKFGPSASTQGCPVTIKGDTRMTRVGRFLAVTKLDELPQLLNILRGEMAFVGPRPESLAFEDCFDGQFSAVLDHRPGLFGPSQVAFRSETDLYPEGIDPTEFYRRVLFPTKAHLDLDYFPRRTMLGDVGWLVRGAFAVIGFRPAALSPVGPRAALSTARAAGRRTSDRQAELSRSRLMTKSPTANLKGIPGE